MSDFDIPSPPNAIIVAIHRHKNICLGQPTMAFNAHGRKMPFYAKDQIVTYQIWDGEQFHLCDVAFCDLRWHIA
jgi:hypothetical protein